MAKLKPLTIGELESMNTEDLLYHYNRVAARINRRISRAGGIQATGYKRMPEYRTKVKIAQFKGIPRGKIISEIRKAESLSHETIPSLRKFENLKFEMKRSIRQTFAGQHLSGDYTGKWVDELTTEELSAIGKRLSELKRQSEEAAGGDRNVFWYIYRRAHIIGSDVEPIRSKEDFLNALSVAEGTLETENEMYGGIEPSDITRRIAEGVVGGRYK